MGSPYLGEIRIFSFGFAPKGWAGCNGQLMPINQNQALFSLLGTTFGGNGTTTFALPNLQGRVPLHIGPGFPEGQVSGEESHTVSTVEMPAHTHTLSGSTNAGDAVTPVGSVLAAPASPLYAASSALTAVGQAAASITPLGGGQPHENRQPFLAVNICMSLQGIFPSRN